uniref:Secreted protein n=1 Tax=Arion vulgaris TaxID=1028688 RepID=A0A0B7ANI3_9EUPU
MFYILLMSITAVVAPVSGSCTNTSIHKAQMCTAQLTGQNSANAFITQGDAERAVLACRNGDLLTAVNCIERVMTECKNDNTDAAHFLRNMIDIDKSRRSVQFFCTNVQDYTMWLLIV